MIVVVNWLWLVDNFFNDGYKNYVKDIGYEEVEKKNVNFRCEFGFGCNVCCSCISDEE